MWHPDVTVAAICERDDRFLMVEERSKSSNQIVINQPAGHLEDGESIIQAVVRETLEETCCHFVPEALVGVYRLRTGGNRTYLRVTFCGRVGNVDPNQQLDPDILRTHWLSLAELEKNAILRSDLVLSCVRDYLAGVRFPLSLLREF